MRDFMNQLILWVVKHLPKPLQNIYFKYEKGLLYCFYGALTTLVSMITKLVPMYFLGEGKLSVTFCTVFSWICAVTFAFFTNKKYEDNLLYNRVIRCVYKGAQKTFV